MEQKTLNIAGVEIGGQPWERSTVLIGSIFYSGDKIVKDSLKGVFEEEILKLTGNTRFIDVVGETTEALKEVGQNIEIMKNQIKLK